MTSVVPTKYWRRLDHNCGQILIGRDWFELSDWHLTDEARCKRCGTECTGVFAG